MENSVDHILDRRRMRRKLTVWRVVAFVAAGLAIIGLVSSLSPLRNLEKQSDHIARVPVTGFIASSRYAMEQLEKIKKDNRVKAVIISVDSPGGTTVGGEALHNALRAVAEEKPVVTSIGGLAASAGYMVAVAGDHVVAPRTSIVGSVGVVIQYPNATELMRNIGLSVEEIKSSPLKAEPSPFNETPPEAAAMLESMLLDTYDWFVGLVKERRGFSDSQAEELLDGSVFTGAQALERKLIDQIGDENTAKEWLVSEKDISKDLKVVPWSLSRQPDEFLVSQAILKPLVSTLGLGNIIRFDDKNGRFVVPSHLDGFLSVWQVESQSGN